MTLIPFYWGLIGEFFGSGGLPAVSNFGAVNETYSGRFLCPAANFGPAR